MIFLHQIDPVAVSLGPLRVHWYGLMYLLGFLLAWWLGRRRIRAGRLPGVDEDGFGDLLFYGLIGVIVGGRLGSVLFYDFNTYLQNPLQVLKVWEGGMSFHGGLIGVLVAAWLWSRRHRRHFFDTMDFLAPLVPPGLGFGRIGNYIGGELWGKYTRGDWGVVFPSGLPEPYRSLDPVALKAQFDAGALDAFARHPSQLDQALLEGLALFGVLWWFSAKPRPRYAVSGLFALLYGSFRFLVEFVRMPDAHLGDLAFGWLTMGQVLSLPLVALGLCLLWRSRSAPVLQPQSVPPAKEAKR